MKDDAVGPTPLESSSESLLRSPARLPPVCTVLPLLFMHGSAYYLLLLLPLSAVLLQSAVATLSGSSRAGRVTDYECTAQYKDKNNTYWFSFIKFEGSFLLTTAMKDKSRVNLSPPGNTGSCERAPKCIEGIAAYMGLGYLYSTNRGGARVIINNRLLSTSRRSSATEGGNLDAATKSRRLVQEVDDAPGAKLPDAPEGIRTAITSLKRSKSGAFELSNSLYAEDGVRGIYDVVERVITVDPENGISSGTPVGVGSPMVFHLFSGYCM
ncbi:hypothetical protein FOZ60_016287 [Perkinsus olseni]|uniref:Uncharacterized protein n=1 Tax=Perkinsus olseni TaxID=32597 RepID=A0A7J6P4N0_PEROL|nr:hypothetical protein FOZ60_016287 [Perkinsus olseni]